MFVDNPGVSIVAIDPGGTTGVAVWDAWTKKLYVDQIDAGRGRKAREHVYGGITESPERKRVSKRVGKVGELDLLCAIESGVCAVIEDLLLAVGPLSVVICEDFVLYQGRPGIANGKREGLSPVRIGIRLEERLTRGGYRNGDVWRRWGLFDISGVDGRGVKVPAVRSGGSLVEMPYRIRVAKAEAWRMAGGEGDEMGVVWAGGGSKLLWKMPGSRHFIGGSEDKTVEWLRERWLWMPSAPHGMDALMHLMAFARRLGSDDLARPERIWQATKPVR